VELPPIVNKLRPFLSTPLPLLQPNLRQHLVGLDCLRLALAEARVDALSELQTKRKQMLWPKDKDMTELDRTTRLNGDVSVYEKNWQFLVQLEEIVKDQLELGKLFIKV
jgi:hypothetical protein